MVNRNRSLRGEKHLQAKLTNKQVEKIYRQLLNGVKGTLLAKEYGVNHRTIYSIKHQKSWKFLTDNIKGDNSYANTRFKPM